MQADYRRRLGRTLGVFIVLGALAAGGLVWRVNDQRPRTNDAMVQANIVGIAPEVGGRIVELAVEDNQFVHQGDLLYVIDPRPYQARLDKARAELLLAAKEVDSRRAASSSASNAIDRLRHQETAAKAAVAKLAAEDEYLHSYLQRIEPLADKGFVTADQLKQARARYAASRAELADAEAKSLSAGSAIQQAISDSRQAQALIAESAGVNARIEAARAAVTAAELDVEYCSVRAPFDSYVSNLNTREGEFAKVGSQMFALVDNRHWYVIANFKETYLHAIHPGQAADVFLVGYPGKHFRGVVSGIGWANYPDNTRQQGVLPEVQRTLHWVLLASRFPVRIEILDRDPAHPLRMGMTAFATILDAPGQQLTGGQPADGKTQPAQ